MHDIIIKMINNKDNNPDKFFKPYLYRLSIYAWVLKLISIPYGLLTAKLMANIVELAVDGKATKVINVSLILIALTTIMIIFRIATSTAFEKYKANMVHKCKLKLYQQFLSHRLFKLYDITHGDAIERLTNDFDIITAKQYSLIPSFYTGIATVIIYFTFLAKHSQYISLSLLGISIIQIFPPLIVKHFMQINYDRTREIEAELTNYIVSSYHGFATIKLYDLKEWYINKLKDIHRRYLKIGTKSELVCQAECSMDNFLASVLKYGMYGIIGFMVLKGLSTMNTAVEAIALSGSLFGSVKTIFNSITDFAIAKKANNRVAIWLNNEPECSGSVFCEDDHIVLNDFSYSHTSNDNMLIKNWSIDIPLRGITVIKGANGIGKSTFMKLIIGLLNSDYDSIKIAGAQPINLTDEELVNNLFYLPQDDVQFSITPSEFFGMICNDTEFYLCLSISKKLGLTNEQLTNTKMNDLSGGELKKAYLSVAFALDKRIMMMDEPTNSLDIQGKDILIDLLKSRTKSTLIITHDDDISKVADTILTLSEGGIAYEGSQDKDLQRLRKSDGHTAII